MPPSFTNHNYIHQKLIEASRNSDATVLFVYKYMFWQKVRCNKTSKKVTSESGVTVFQIEIMLFKKRLVHFVILRDIKKLQVLRKRYLHFEIYVGK